nr:PREDICTED: uncharacterized protein LOC105673278 [Linepithema humile]
MAKKNQKSAEDSLRPIKPILLSYTFSNQETSTQITKSGYTKAWHNQELYQQYKDISLSNFVKLQRLQWAEHVARMPEQRIPRRILESRMEGQRPAGRPRRRWREEVTEDSRNMLGFRNWGERAKDRDRWREKMKEARARMRAVAP